MSPPDSAADAPPSPPASEPVTPSKEPASDCQLPAEADIAPEQKHSAAAMADGFTPPSALDTDLIGSETPASNEGGGDEPVITSNLLEEPIDEAQTVESEESQKPGPEQAPSKLVLPSWFLEKNVVLSEDLRASPPPLALFNAGTQEPAAITKTDTSADDEMYSADYEVHESIYDEVKDMVFSGLQLANGWKPPSESWVNTAAFLLESPQMDNVDFLRALVHHLARDFGADLVSIDREDLEDLLHHFWYMTDESISPHQYQSSPHLLGAKFFDQWSSFDDKGCKTADAVLTGSMAKRTAEDSAEAEPENRTPLIILMHNVGNYERSRPFARFYEAVKASRSEGLPVLILATAAFDESADEYDRPYIMSRVRDRLCLDSSKIVNVSPRRTERTDQVIQRNMEENIARAEWRQFRRVLRHALGPEIVSDVLSPVAEWRIADIEQTVEKWNDPMMARAIRQICTRARRTSKLELSDITEVFARVLQNKAIVTEAHDENCPTEDRSEDGTEDGGEASTGSQRRQDLLDTISPQCSENEKGFFDCVIDTDTLTATAQSIRVDDDLVESLDQLLSLRVHKSYGLLAQESVNGAILYGPPGTGKTHLARVVAKSAGTNLIVATPADIQSCWVGETEKRIKALFSLGVKLAPSIIFLDEGDSLFARRQSGDQEWTRKAMSQLLMEMDGLCKQDQPPFLLVATNRPADIDDAVCRRLPHMLHVGMPSTEDRRAILDIYLKEEQVGEDVTLEALAATGTKGFSGSDIRTLCVQAAMAAQREIDLERRKKGSEGTDGGGDEAHTRKITMSHFNTALARTRPSVTRESLLEIQRFANQQRRSR